MEQRQSTWRLVEVDKLAAIFGNLHLFAKLQYKLPFYSSLDLGGAKNLFYARSTLHSQYMAPRTKLPQSEVKEKRRKSQIFHCRKNSHISKAAKLHEITEASIYLVYQFGIKVYTFKATKIPNWPPSEEQIVSGNLPPDLTNSH
jgi:hypothetical protein